jgi:hypothetical protein
MFCSRIIEELAAERAKRIALEDDVRRLSRVVEDASLPLPDNVVKLRTAASAAAAAAAVSAPAAPRGFLGDHPDLGA